MNGRIYDPKLGRFLQADPFVQSPKNSQSLNRYSYVLNNPLSYTDPSGYFIKELVTFIAAVVNVIYTWENPNSWRFLAVAAANLFNAKGSQQRGLPTGVVTGAFISGFTAVTSTFANVVKHESLQEPRNPGDRISLATVGLTGSAQTFWKFLNGAGTTAFAHTANTEQDQASTKEAVVRKYEKLKRALEIQAAKRPTGALHLSAADLNVILERQRYRALEQPIHNEWIWGNDIRSQFSGYDTFLRTRFKNRQFSIEGRSLVWGGHLNYIAVGMLAAHYGPNYYQALPLIVLGWNSWQGFVVTDDSRHLKDIGPGIKWSLVGANYFRSRQ
ncbi:MAG: hypothetical protein DRR42_17360 [Gammaproteobacteria bacterium]|nr:MAG: hypothetical protein DRR42_17360 [Gammaproteobacteria bacterium]